MTTKVYVGILLLCVATTAYGWNGEEHNIIGSCGYAVACGELAKHVEATGDTASKERYRLVCTAVGVDHASGDTIGANYSYAPLAGEWSALAADHAQTPEQLNSIQLGDIAIDYRSMAENAVTNYRHFHPVSVTSWRTEHFSALEAVASAATKTGIPLVEAFEKGMAIEAFAQHYLQDSFAAGHMGFNRVGSSKAASLAYHNEASIRGRCVANVKGEAWVTYGDGNLNRSPDGWKHAVLTSSLSWYDFLATFVSGVPVTTRWQLVWAEFPAYYKDDESGAVAPCTYDADMKALRTVSRTAGSVTTFDSMTVADGTMWGGDPVVVGVIFGGSVEWVYTIPVGYRQLQSRLLEALV